MCSSDLLGLTIVGVGAFLAYCVHEARKMLAVTTRISMDLLMLESNPDHEVSIQTYAFIKGTAEKAENWEEFK